MHFTFFLWSKSDSQTRVITNQQLNLHHGAESFMCSQQLLSLLRDSLPFTTSTISLPHAQELREMNPVHFLATHFLDWFNPDGNCTFHQVFLYYKALHFAHTHSLCVPCNSYHKSDTFSTHPYTTLFCEAETEYLYSCRLTFVFKGFNIHHYLFIPSGFFFSPFCWLKFLWLM